MAKNRFRLAQFSHWDWRNFGKVRSQRKGARQRILLIEVHAIWRIALVVSLLTMSATFAFGVATGESLQHRARPGVNSSEAQAQAQAQRDYEMNQLGILNAALLQIKPRILQLSQRIDELDQFDEQLKTLEKINPTPTLLTTQKNAVEKQAPPQHLVHNALEQNLQQTQHALHDADAILSNLENAAAARYVSYMAFPGQQPVIGARLSSPFGRRIDPFNHGLSFHPGVDLAAPAGTQIFAAAGGRVILAGPKSGYGNAVEIDHGNGMVTRYGHASRVEVHVGDVVLPGQEIARVGSTGRSTGPHLHFELLINNAVVNPTHYVALFRPKMNS